MYACGLFKLLSSFESFSAVLEWVAKNKLRTKHTLHILDDTLIIASTSGLCEAQLALFPHFCKDLGVPMAPEKILGPSTVLSFAEIELDNRNSEAQ